MIQVDSIQRLAAYDIRNVVLAIGTFDGLHVGHRAVLTKLSESAEKFHSIPVAVTFSPHPRTVLCPEHAPDLLISENSRIRMFEKFGCRAVVVIPFTKELAVLSPNAFLDRILFCPEVRIHAICVGASWRFGVNASGNAKLLEMRSEQDNFAFCPVPEIMWNGKPVSSTVIRGLIQSGDVRQAAELLGYHPAISGTVVHGNRVASDLLQCATANVDVSAGILPCDGVYCARAERSGNPMVQYQAVINIGVAPTFHVGKRRVEVHLLNCEAADFYGETLTISLVRKLRDERTFSNVSLLMAQIKKDIELTEAILSNGE